MGDQRMTVDELVVLAADVARNGSECDSTAEKLALEVLDLLAEDAPCGWEMPRITGGGKYVCIPESWATGHTPEDARAIARMILRAADEADAKGGGK